MKGLFCGCIWMHSHMQCMNPFDMNMSRHIRMSRFSYSWVICWNKGFFCGNKGLFCGNKGLSCGCIWMHSDMQCMSNMIHRLHVRFSCLICWWPVLEKIAVSHFRVRFSCLVLNILKVVSKIHVRCACPIFDARKIRIRCARPNFVSYFDLTKLRVRISRPIWTRFPASSSIAGVPFDSCQELNDSIRGEPDIKC